MYNSIENDDNSNFEFPSVLLGENYIGARESSTVGDEQICRTRLMAVWQLKWEIKRKKNTRDLAMS